jgi:alpha-glutamyl/putrescinyl thymine pyrophosphorylase clade 1
VRYKYHARQLKMLWYWMNERHRIYEARKAGAPYPWTKDPILHEYKFTNVFRELDRVTKEWKIRYAHLLAIKKRVSDEDLFFRLCMFRFFNWPDTYDELHFNMRGMWNKDRAVELLRHRQEFDHEQIFTGAYIVTSGGKGVPKHEVICDALQDVWERRNEMLKVIRKADSMEGAVEILQTVNTVGPFVAYEVACDMRHTKLLPKPTDVNTWANPGPGAKRGIHRLLTGKAQWKKGKKPDYIDVMCELLLMSKDSLKTHVLSNTDKLPFEMREIEHSLCELDKYLRVKNGEGFPRSRYWYREKQEYTDDEE